MRPLAADPGQDVPSTSVSREDRIDLDDTGLVSVFGGKLTTYRAMAERIVDRVVRALPRERRRGLRPSATAHLPLRRDDFDADALAAELRGRFGVGDLQARHLVSHYGDGSVTLLAESPPEWRDPIGRSRFSYAEIPWSWQTECPAGLCDLLERRLRMALFSRGQGLPELERIALVASAAAGWDAERRHEESRAYAAAVRCRYQIRARDSDIETERSAA